MNTSLLRRMLSYQRPYVWPYFVGDVFTAKNAATLQVLPFAIIAVFIFRGVCSFGSSYLTEYVSNQVINDLRNDLNAHIQDLSLSFFNKNATGTVLSRVTSDVYVV